MHKPLLTIAIPTYNRAKFLELSIQQLKKDASLIEDSTIEVMIYDDCSTDNTEDVIKNAINKGMKINHSKNQQNLGLDGNVAKCINEAKGKYIVILGDDDLFIDGAIQWLVNTLKQKDYGVVCMKAYGYERDHNAEFPGRQGKEKEFTNFSDFLISIGPLVTFTSVCVFNKEILGKFDAKENCGSWLVHVPLILASAIKAKINLYSTRYHIAAKRNNSGGYDFIKVFVKNLGVFLDALKKRGVSEDTILKFDRKMMINYLPFYLLRQRLRRVSQEENIILLKNRYGKSIYLWFWLLPTAALPRPIAIVYGCITTAIGRLFNGDILRGVYYLKNKLR
jgi:glycosyltransferase involved in cell wall biosynthesis